MISSTIVLVEISFQGKKKCVKHKAATQISEILSMYERRLRSRLPGGSSAAMRVCDADGVEQGSEVTLGLLYEASRGVEDHRGPVRLFFEEDDWFD